MVDMQREEWLSLMLSELPDRLLIIDEHGRIVDSFGEATQSDPELTSKYLNRTFSEILPESLAENLQHHFKQALTSGQRKTLQYSMTPCQQLLLSIEELEAWNGVDERWFEASLKPITLASGAKYVLWQEKEITKAHLHQVELKKLAETDELTGILNRRAFMLRLEREFDSPTQQHLSCLMIDIDHFKEINDQVGHLSGDEVIVQVAHICQGLIRSSDYIGRLGGEEFGVVLSRTNAIQAYDIAERIRHSIETTPCQVDDHIILPTVSIGIAELNDHVSSVRELMVQADKAMYYSKQTGRNQVTLYYENLPDIKSTTELKANIRRAS
ncbi:sensor domain-containing diguanylate cyclase [Vibrio europaeus]|uniref:sensor domain-containing diguanylate cyclase n=1 Tax=Vibrio europaeus TaxID=300876 RepID=UPI00233E6DA5|nr:sensor domain-containing diguanylate cyclase [Vibrio europaeus]MDC5822069.1 GGDEF domain-containing protein [Vibrio europaeus]MDC5837950.1 GGDEF domain-containing protein [Vibrio europaeus]MDC5855154.1 GGDEF domain-containing protein [Vibrio europaeus]MDC5870084.1 GGDEF domain-containing protein [Vibrio europaeus]